MNTVSDIEIMRKQVDRMLMSMIGNQTLVDNWWTGENIFFKLKTPDDVWKIDPIEVYNYVAGHCFR